MRSSSSPARPRLPESGNLRAIRDGRRILHLALILVPISVGLALLAPWALGLFGAGYAAHGALILELLAVATLPKTVTGIYVGALRGQSKTSLIALIQGVRWVLVLGLALALTGLVGTVGAR